MTDLVKISENETDVIYIIDKQGMVVIPKNLTNNINFFMFFNEYTSQENERANLINNMNSFIRTVNQNEKNSILLVSFLESQSISLSSAYTIVFDNVKKFVNTVYNILLSKGNLRKENFIKRIELLTFNNAYNQFANWLCLQYPAKFRFAGYQFNVSKNDNLKKSDMFISNNSANIFNEPTRQSTMMGMQSNIRPVDESLSIGTPKIENISNTNMQTIRYNNNSYFNNHGNAAFIKWYTALFILLVSLVIGIGISIVFVK